MFTVVEDQKNDGYEDNDNVVCFQGHNPLYDHDHGHDYENGFDLDYMKDVNINTGYDGDDNCDGHIDLEEPL